MEPWTTAGLGDGRMELRSDNGEELLAALNGLPESAKTVKHVVWHLMKKEENENENENENKNEKEKEKDGRQLAASQEAQDRGLQVLGWRLFCAVCGLCDFYAEAHVQLSARKWKASRSVLSLARPPRRRLIQTRAMQHAIIHL